MRFKIFSLNSNKYIRFAITQSMVYNLNCKIMQRLELSGIHSIFLYCYYVYYARCNTRTNVLNLRSLCSVCIYWECSNQIRIRSTFEWYITWWTPSLNSKISHWRDFSFLLFSVIDHLLCHLRRKIYRRQVRAVSFCECVSAY